MVYSLYKNEELILATHDEAVMGRVVYDICQDLYSQGVFGGADSDSFFRPLYQQGYWKGLIALASSTSSDGYSLASEGYSLTSGFQLKKP